MKSPPRRSLRDRIVDAALAAADEEGWERVALHRIADRLGLDLPQVRAEFVDLNAVADAWLDRADEAMIRAGGAEGPPPERLERALLAWFDALGGRRRVLRAVLGYKLAPAHVHHQAALVVATSRRVQWLRDAARLAASGAQRQVEEIGLTAVFASATLLWLFDREDGAATRRYVRRALAASDRAMGALFRRR
jgi:ubiquinone biosynthesis protein COQ9